MLARYIETKDGLRLWVRLPLGCDRCPNIEGELVKVRNKLFTEESFVRGIVEVRCEGLPSERKIHFGGVVDGVLFGAQNLLDEVSIEKCCSPEPKKAARS